MSKRLIAIALAGLIITLLAASNPPSSLGFSAGQSEATIVVDASDVTGTIRSLQGINAGPRGKDRPSHLFRQYEDIGVDYVHTHDYYGPSDMHVLFPDLQADPDDESSYDFTSTDRELEAIKRVGAEMLFRLGYSWGFPTAPVTYVAPEDHQAWARAAAHVAMHYNDGWADGFHWDIECWEVWNLIELGGPLGDLHCLISIGEGEGWGNTVVRQCSVALCAGLGRNLQVQRHPHTKTPESAELTPAFVRAPGRVAPRPA